MGNNNLGMKISQEGVNVKEAEPHELLFSSKYNVLKVAFEGLITNVVTTAPLTVTEEFTHDLGYVPMFQYRVIVPASLSGYSEKVAYDQMLDDGLIQVRPYADTTKFYVDCNYAQNETWEHYYVIYYDRIV